MTRKRLIHLSEKVGLKLTEAQRSLLLDFLLLIPKEVERAIQTTPVDEPLMLTLGDLDDLAGHVAAGANHAEDKALRDKLDRISRKIEKVLGSFTDEAPIVEEEPSRFALDLIDLLMGQEPLILPPPSEAKKGGECFPVKLTEKQREAMMGATRLRRGLKNKIGDVPEGTQFVEFTRKELDQMASELEIAIGFAPPTYKKRLVAVLASIKDLLGELD
jgi:hypothetical protein